MTQSLERSGADAAASEVSSATAAPPADPAEQSVRELLAELTDLEDALRGATEWANPAAVAREQAILAELHRRYPYDSTN